METVTRVWAAFLRYLFLHKRSMPRTLELVFWPVMELLVWGFVAMYVSSVATGPLAKTIFFLINAIIFWDILYRSQQGVTISFIEDIWTQNIINFLISPLKLWEWLLATFLYGMVKSLLIMFILSGIAVTLYHFDVIGTLGITILPLVLNLLLFGWSLGVVTSAMLLRWGHAAEALIWGVPFLFQPFSAIYYPLSVLPEGVQVISRALPTTYVFEGMRAVIQTSELPIFYFWMSFGLNIVYFVGASLLFRWIYGRAHASGHLGRLGMD